MAVAVALGGTGAAFGQVGGSFVTCSSQQDIEQYLDSRGELIPEGCRTVEVSSLDSGGRRLCVADISSEGESVLGSIADAAVPTQWWADCDDAFALVD